MFAWIVALGLGLLGGGGGGGVLVVNRDQNKFGLLNCLLALLSHPLMGNKRDEKMGWTCERGDYGGLPHPLPVPFFAQYHNIASNTILSFQ